jgi:hypothetical protein
MWTSDKKLWRTERGKIVLDGDVRARALIAMPGDELPEKPVIEKFEGAKMDEKSQKLSEDKAKHPDSDKSKKPDQNKSRSGEVVPHPTLGLDVEDEE